MEVMEAAVLTLWFQYEPSWAAIRHSRPIDGCSRLALAAAALAGLGRLAATWRCSPAAARTIFC